MQRSIIFLRTFVGNMSTFVTSGLSKQTLIIQLNYSYIQICLTNLKYFFPTMLLFFGMFQNKKTQNLTNCVRMTFYYMMYNGNHKCTTQARFSAINYFLICIAFEPCKTVYVIYTDNNDIRIKICYKKYLSTIPFILNTQMLICYEYIGHTN